MSTPVHSVINAFREICGQIFYSLLGESAFEATLFFLRRGLGRDPFEVFWNDPKTFYHEMEKVFGVGAKVLIKLLMSRINSEFGLNMSPERFLELMRRGDERSVEEIRSFLIKIAELYRGQGGAIQ
ncbi:MAG: hypothetical protein QW424_02625 [Candidatus Bathyarchaeia archaeon]